MTRAFELRDIVVRFGPITALDGVSLSVAPGEIHAVVGENGAGKSTLMRTLFGLCRAERGEIFVKGERVAEPTPERSLARGLGMVHQHFMLVDTLTVAENVALGREPLRRGLFDRARTARQVAELGARHRWEIDPHRLVGDLSVGERQRVEILKVLYRGADILILDEPTAVLTPPEVEELFGVLRELRAAGSTVVIVTHKLDEVMALSERVTVLRRGACVASLETAETSPAEIARAMVGREVASTPPPTSVAIGESVLSIEGLTVAGCAPGLRALDGVTLTVRAGEILGVAGVEGNGQTELGEAIAGLVPVVSGRIVLGGVEVTRATPRRRRALGLGHVPEDRHRRGGLLASTVTENLLLGREAGYARLCRLDRRRLAGDVARLLEEHDVRPADPQALFGSLSGGNQQKVIMARELERRPKLLLAAQPTRGVDIGAIERIHGELRRVRAEGGAVLLISAELEELEALADRIAVLYRGRIVAQLERREASRARLGALMTGAELAAGAHGQA